MTGVQTCALPILEGMATAGLITEKEVHALKAAWWNLKQWRIALHLLTGRHEDRLIFDIQEELAKVLGYEATELMRASEAFMKRYYLNARSVVQLSVIQLQTLANKILGEVRAETTPTEDPAFVRSEERRVGKECRIGCRSRWSPYH